jgi:type I restriction enzyme S subunit
MQILTLNASKKTKSTPAGEIPVDWGSARLEDLLSGRPEYGANSPSVPYLEGQTPRLIRITDIDAWGRLLDDPKVGIIPEAGAGYELSEGDLLIARTGATAGKSMLFKRLRYPAVFAGYLIRFRLDKTRIDEGFVRQYLASPLYWKWITTTSRSGAQPNINAQEYCSLELPLPPIAEQRKIADILSRWDEALEKLDALINAKERQRKGLMQKLLTGSVRFPQFGGTPWRKVRMNTVMARIFRPIKWAADKPLSLVSLRRRCGGLFRRADILGADYKTQDLHELEANDFLVSKRQVSHGAWGLVTSEFEGSHVSKEYAILVNIAPKTLHMPFFGWLTQMPRMIRLARVASIGVHIEKLIFDPDVFLRDNIVIPPTLAEQQRIAETLDGCAAEVGILQRQRAALDRQKRGLMQKLLTGKLRIKNK